MNQLWLYEVKYRRVSHPYKGRGKVETTELFAEDKKSINTYRLAGFQRDSIEIISAKRKRKVQPIEITYYSVERNELIYAVDINAHINATLNHDERLEKQLTRYADKHECDLEEAFEALGYVEVAHDNSYNWSADFSDDVDFKVFMPADSNSDWIWSDEARVIVDVHCGLDIRGGYSRAGVFAPGFDGLVDFVRGYVDLWLVDKDGKETGWDFDGEGATYRMLETEGFKLTRVEDGIAYVAKDGQEFEVVVWHPAMN